MDVAYFPALSSNLTQLYSETKKSALSNVVKEDATPRLATLQRKFRIQKDRLITWGLEWSEQGKGPEGNIDQSVARAGLTETVTSVLENIKEVLDQAEKIKSASTSSHSQAWPTIMPPEKSTWQVIDEPKYEDLIKDLTASIDTLYDLSRSRRALATGSHPTFSNNVQTKSFETNASISRTPSFASSQLTLVNPPTFARPNLSPYAGLPPTIEPSALVLPEEQPPPYETSGVPFTTRMIGRLQKSRVSATILETLKCPFEEAVVMVEFANFDPLYRDTGVPPPLQRLEALHGFLQTSSLCGLRLLGYVEDPDRPRIGLVYDPMGLMHEKVAEMGILPDTITQVSLLHLLQTASRSTKSSESVSSTPALEARFQLALRLASQLEDMHSSEFSHGNINSGSVTFVRQNELRNTRHDDLRFPVLGAFDLFSNYRVERHNSPLTLNIYKHPNDVGTQRERSTGIKYDIFGLGLLLLEIGLWSPLGDLYKAKYQLSDFKLRLEKIWIPRLASKCGSAYMRVVQTCLRFSDDDDNQPASDRTYQSILTRLRRCCMLDEELPTDLAGTQQKSDTIISDRSSAINKLRKRRNVSPQPSSRGDMSTRRSLDTTISPPSHAPFRLASLPNITASLPLAMAGLTSQTDEATSAQVFSDRTKLNRSLSTSSDLKGMESIRESISSVKDTVHQVWRQRRETSTFCFRDYRRKVVLIQSQWRKRCEKSSAASSPAGSAEPSVPTATVSQDENRITRNNPRLDHINTSVSTSDPRPSKLRMFPVDLPQDKIDEWHSHIGLRLARIVERALKDSPESSSIDIVGLGTNLGNARPTILVTCASTKRVKAAIKRKFDYDKTSFDLKIRKGRVSLSRAQGRRSMKEGGCGRSSGPGSTESESGYVAPQNPYYQQRPLCGASIGAYLPDEGHLLPVSFGGVILVDDKPFGMSVHHMLEPPSDDESGQSDSEDGVSASAVTGAEDDSRGKTLATRVSRSSARFPPSNLVSSRRRPSQSLTGPSEQSSDDEESMFGLESDSDDDAEYFSSDFESDVSDIESLSEDNDLQDSGDLIEPGDTSGFDISDEHGVSVTQPALTDAVDQKLHLDEIPQEEQDEEHLLSYKLGRLHASSGLRRYRTGGLRHEIDWALIELKPPRLQPYNLVQGGRRYCSTKPSFCPALESPICRHPTLYTAEEDLYPTKIRPANALANLSVLCFGRTTGLQSGTIGAGMSFVKIYGRQTFSSSWTVVGDFGIGGDSGAWVINSEDGAVCGHVLAERGGLTYICPMEILVEDIKRTLGADHVGLPGAEDSSGAEAQESRGTNDEDEVDVLQGDRLAGVVEALMIDTGKAVRSGLGSMPARADNSSLRQHQVIPG